MPGAVIVVIVMVLIGPIAVMVAGAVWTALVGWSLVDDAESRATDSATDG